MTESDILYQNGDFCVVKEKRKGMYFVIKDIGTPSESITKRGRKDILKAKEYCDYRVKRQAKWGRKEGESMTLHQSINELSAAIDKNIELLAKQREDISMLVKLLDELEQDISDATEEYLVMIREVLKKHGVKL